MTGSVGRPRVVAIGGGHGLAATLRAARSYARAITAIVSLADDGGSSGRLRDELGIAPPGDLRKCLVALADEETESTRRLAKAFEYRFETDELAGHALGNLLIAGLIATTGDLQLALDEASSLLGCDGRVVPASAEPVVLEAETATGAIRGQALIMKTPGIERVSLVPPDVAAPTEALCAIEDADQVVLGPGSLFTSVLAALGVSEITTAVAKCRARRVYVANLRPQVGEAQGLDLAGHLAALRSQGVMIDTVVADTTSIALGDTSGFGVEVVEAKLAKPNGLAHDPDKLAEVLAGLVA